MTDPKIPQKLPSEFPWMSEKYQQETDLFASKREKIGTYLSGNAFVLYLEKLDLFVNTVDTEDEFAYAAKKGILLLHPYYHLSNAETKSRHFHHADMIARLHFLNYLNKDADEIMQELFEIQAKLNQKYKELFMKLEIDLDENLVEEIENLNLSENNLIQAAKEAAKDGVVRKIKKAQDEKARRCTQVAEEADLEQNIEKEIAEMMGLTHQELLRREMLLGIKP